MNQTIFNHMAQEHGLTLLESEMQDIAHAIEKDNQQPGLVSPPTTGMPRLHLNLYANWFDMIASGRKPVEYRAIGGHWDKIFVYPDGSTGRIKIAGKLYRPDEIVICFSNGYRKTRRQMLVACKGISKGPGNPLYGGERSRAYHCLELGGIVELPFVG